MKHWRIALSAFFLWPLMDLAHGKIVFSGLYDHTIGHFIEKKAFLGDKSAQNMIFQWLQKQQIEKMRFSKTHKELPSIYKDLGFCYQNGWGCIPDEVKAVRFFQEAISQGDKLACFYLATLYYKGKGSIKQDRDQAKQLFALGLRKNKSAFYFFQALGTLRKSSADFLSWVIQIDFTKGVPPLTPEKAQEFFETFTFFINQSTEMEIRFLKLMAEDYWDVWRMGFSYFHSFLKKSLALIDVKHLK